MHPSSLTPLDQPGSSCPVVPSGCGDVRSPEALLTDALLQSRSGGLGLGQVSQASFIYSTRLSTAPVKSGAPRGCSERALCVCTPGLPGLATRVGAPGALKGFCHQPFSTRRASEMRGHRWDSEPVRVEQPWAAHRTNSAVWGWGQGQALHVLILSILL